VDFTVDLAIDDADWETRIGRVMPDGEDHWWHFFIADDGRTVAEEVVAAIREYALPALQRELHRRT
jgi:hypothetical protein